MASYLKRSIIFIEIEGDMLSERYIKCGVPQGSIPGPLLFLIHVNDISQSVNCNIFLYADDSSLIVTHKDINYIEKTLNTNLSSLCDWLVDSKLSIYLGKTESILFGTSNRLAKVNHLNIQHGNHVIEQKQS